MANVRYQVDGLPGDGWANAFLPMPTLSPAGTFSLRRFIHGFPGTQRVASPKPAGSYSLSRSALWAPPSDPRVAPDWFAPQLYWNDIDALPVAPSASGVGVRALPGRRAFPVEPVGDIGGPPPVAMGGRKVGGHRSMHWPRTVIRWPNLAGRYQ